MKIRIKPIDSYCKKCGQKLVPKEIKLAYYNDDGTPKHEQEWVCPTRFGFWRNFPAVLFTYGHTSLLVCELEKWAEKRGLEQVVLEEN